MTYIKGKKYSFPLIGTFHSISVKFLRRHAEAKLGYKSNFTILDTDDQKKLIRNIVKGRFRCKKFSPQLILYHIDQWKNKGQLPNNVRLEKSDNIIKSILKVYEYLSKK